jgi:hypothetical protein
MPIHGCPFLKPSTMIIFYVLLILAVLGLGLILFNVPISQKAINIILLLAIALIAAAELWGERVVLR